MKYLDITMFNNKKKRRPSISGQPSPIFILYMYCLLQRHIAVFLRRIALALVLSHFQSLDKFETCIFW